MLAHIQECWPEADAMHTPTCSVSTRKGRCQGRACLGRSRTPAPARGRCWAQLLSCCPADRHYEQQPQPQKTALSWRQPSLRYLLRSEQLAQQQRWRRWPLRHRRRLLLLLVVLVTAQPPLQPPAALPSPLPEPSAWPLPGLPPGPGGTAWLPADPKVAVEQGSKRMAVD